MRSADRTGLPSTTCRPRKACIGDSPSSCPVIMITARSAGLPRRAEGSRVDFESRTAICSARSKRSKSRPTGRKTGDSVFIFSSVSPRLLEYSREKAAWIYMTRDFVLSAPHRDDNTVRGLGERLGALSTTQKGDQPAHHLDLLRDEQPQSHSSAWQLHHSAMQ